jgi:hypothetical protein
MSEARTSLLPSISGQPVVNLKHRHFLLRITAIVILRQRHDIDRDVDRETHIVFFL